jgi:hypothetical protein
VSVHERLEEGMRAVVEGFVVGVIGDAVCVEGDYGVDGRLRCFLGRD